MLKRDELVHNSYLNRARSDEHIFVLLGRDPAAPATIRFWIQQRIRLGKNKEADSQILEARNLAAGLEQKIEEDRYPKPWTIDPNFNRVVDSTGETVPFHFVSRYLP